MEWFNKIKGKLQFFSLGLMAGLIVGGGFFIFKLDDYFKELRAYKNTVQLQQNTDNEDQAREIEKTGKTKKGKANFKKNYEADNGTANTDSLDIQDEGLVFRGNTIDSATTIPIKDSMALALNDNNNAEENVIVRKDELVASKTVEVQNFNPAASSADEKKDSLLHKISGVKEDVVKTSYRVEIWQSPLNYKGYKMTKNKIILYGIVNYESVKLFQLNDEFYIKMPLNSYKIEYSSEFKPLEKITDESILAKLK